MSIPGTYNTYEPVNLDLLKFAYELSFEIRVELIDGDESDPGPFTVHFLPESHYIPSRTGEVVTHGLFGILGGGMAKFKPDGTGIVFILPWQS